MLRKVAELDLNILRYINGYSEEKYDLFWLTATHIITWIPLFLLMLYLIRITFNRRDTLIVLLSIVAILLFTLLLTEAVKEFVMRLRPNNAGISNMLRILKSPEGYSFFSGHASNSMAVSTLVILFLRHQLKWVYIFYLWPLIFAFSRLYMGVHYPSDVLLGFIVGFLLGFVAYRITRYRFLKV